MNKSAHVCFYISILLIISKILVGQSPVLSDLSLQASSPENLTNDTIICTYTEGVSVVESATAWYRNGSPDSRLYLPFEAGASNALLDFSGNNNDASTTGVPSQEPTWDQTTGHNGSGAFTFDGNDYLIAGNAFPLNSDYTKTSWINMSGSGFRNIMSSALNNDNNHFFHVDPYGKLNAGHSFGTAVVFGPDSLHLDQWYFVAVTFDYESGEMILYIDGLEVDRSFVIESLRSVSDASVLIGVKAYIFGWEGVIDEPRIYDYALSAEQIYSMYNSGNNVILPQETHGNDDFFVKVTPFSTTAVGDTYISDNLAIEAAVVSNLSLQTSSVDNLTTDNLLCSYLSNSSVVETALTWYKNGMPEGLLYLPFEGGHSNALLDFSGSDNHVSTNGNRENEPTWNQTGGFNSSGAFIFDGDDYLLAGDILPVNSDYTKSAWVNISGSGFKNIMSSILFDANNHHFKVDSDGRLNAGHSFGNATVKDPDVLNLGQWYFVAVTFDYASGEMVLYKNGSEIGRGTVPENLRSVSDASVLIGAMDYAFGWEGSIDEPRIFDNVLSSEQIQSLYINGNNVIVAEETTGGEEWYVDVTPFARYESGVTVSTNRVYVRSVVVSTIPSQTIPEGSSFSLIDLDDYVVDYDYEDNELVWSSVGQLDLNVTIDPATHIASINIPDINWDGTENISFIATNPGSDSDTAVVTSTVQGINDAPVLSDIGAQNVDEDHVLSGLPVIYTDPDALDSHTISVVSSVSNVSVENLSGDDSGSTYDLVSAANWNGTAEITVWVTDNGTGELSDFETYTLAVNPVNDASALSDIGDQNVDEDNVLSGLPVIYTDPDASDSHSIAVISDETNVTVANLIGYTSGSTYDLVPVANWNGTAQITVTVTDNGTGALSDSETYILEVHETNDAPVITLIGDQSTDEDNILTGISVNFTDLEAFDSHTITVASNDANVSVTNLSGHASGSTFDLVPVADWNGTAQITVTVTDDGPGTLSDSEIFTLTVIPINDMPVSLDLSNKVFDERVATGTVVGFFSTTDIDIGDTHQYKFVFGEMDNDNDAFIIVGDTLKTNTEFDFETQSIYWIRVQTHDSQGGIISSPFIITLNDIDETGVDQINNPLSFTVYPVPAYDQVTVEIDNPKNRELILEIYTNNGTLVHSENTFIGNTIDLNAFADGMYFVTIRGESVYGTRKIIVKDR